MFDSYKLAIPRLTINSQERQKIELADKNNRIDELEQERETSHHLKRNSEQQKEELVTIKNTVFTEAYFFNERLEEQKRFNESMMEKMIEMAKEIRELKSH